MLNSRRCAPPPDRKLATPALLLAAAYFGYPYPLAQAEPQAEKAKALIVASWDMRESKALEAELQAASRQSRPTWRTTFGAERQSSAPEPEPTAAPPSINADILLIQGVPRAKTAGRLFPARRWHLNVSRELFLRPPQSGAHSATAVAVRLRPGVRITAVEHLLDIIPDTSPTATGGDPRPPKLGDTATTAVRVSIDGRSLWLASAALSEACREPNAACPARQKLEAWTSEKLAAGEIVVVGGHLSKRGSEEAPARDCPTQNLEISKGATRTTEAKSTTDERRGCFVYAELTFD